MVTFTPSIWEKDCGDLVKPPDIQNLQRLVVVCLNGTDLKSSPPNGVTYNLVQEPTGECECGPITESQELEDLFPNLRVQLLNGHVVTPVLTCRQWSLGIPVTR